jgi:hypothetical protein
VMFASYSRPKRCQRCRQKKRTQKMRLDAHYD